MVLIGVCLVIVGAAFSCLAIFQIVKPCGWIWMTTRTRAAGGLWVGALLFAIGVSLFVGDTTPRGRVVPAREPLPPVTAEKPTPAPAPPPAAAEPQARPVKQFEFVVQGGHTIVAVAQGDAAPGEKRSVVFLPFVEKTDGNLYLAALETLWNLYGKQRGLFQLDDVETRAKPALGGNAMCWRVSNPAADYCVLPTTDSETGRIGALTVWIE